MNPKAFERIYRLQANFYFFQKSAAGIPEGEYCSKGHPMMKGQYKMRPDLVGVLGSH